MRLKCSSMNGDTEWYVGFESKFDNNSSNKVRESE